VNTSRKWSVIDSSPDSAKPHEHLISAIAGIPSLSNNYPISNSPIGGAIAAARSRHQWRHRCRYHDSNGATEGAS
jgi:hypothetical protein